MYRSFSGLTGHENCVIKSDDEVIVVNKVQPGSSENDGFFYQTIFLKSSEDGVEKESHFFKDLDEEFNKVLRFYKEKVKEVTMRAEELSKQMDTLVALRIKVQKPLMERSGNHQDLESSDLVHEGKYNVEFICHFPCFLRWEIIYDFVSKNGFRMETILQYLCVCDVGGYSKFSNICFLEEIAHQKTNG